MYDDIIGREPSGRIYSSVECNRKMEGMSKCLTTATQPLSPHSRSSTADNPEVQQLVGDKHIAMFTVKSALVNPTTTVAMLLCTTSSCTEAPQYVHHLLILWGLQLHINTAPFFLWFPLPFSLVPTSASTSQKSSPSAGSPSSPTLPSAPPSLLKVGVDQDRVESSVVSSWFILQHNVPHLVKPTPESIQLRTSGPIVVPTPSGWYVSHAEVFMDPSENEPWGVYSWEKSAIDDDQASTSSSLAEETNLNAVVSACVDHGLEGDGDLLFESRVQKPRMQHPVVEEYIAELLISVPPERSHEIQVIDIVNSLEDMRVEELRGLTHAHGITPDVALQMREDMKVWLYAHLSNGYCCRQPDLSGCSQVAALLSDGTNMNNG
ncbi:hypothetical protein GY45DRAFT_1339380 [Cubamyces sp. BRFM 1775]|nr:hypothetical protein GY45DRAFT_1339380 [Cubamyces sp. BRFM 1775]